MLYVPPELELLHPGAVEPYLLGQTDAIVMRTTYGWDRKLPRIPTDEDRLARYHTAIALHGGPPLEPRTTIGEAMRFAWGCNALPVLPLIGVPA